MAKGEKLIERGPGTEAPKQAAVPFYKGETFLLVLKLSLALGIISSLLTGMILTNMRLGKLENTVADTMFEVEQLSLKQEVVVTNLKQLTQDHHLLVSKVTTLDIEAAKGDLSVALNILDTQSQNIDKQLATTRNGLISLSRMVKGSRVWQEDYRGQYQTLFDANKKLKAKIKSLRGIKKKEAAAPRYIEMDF